MISKWGVMYGRIPGEYNLDGAIAEAYLGLGALYGRTRRKLLRSRDIN
jgi:hypothetical protein